VVEEGPHIFSGCTYKPRKASAPPASKSILGPLRWELPLAGSVWREFKGQEIVGQTARRESRSIGGGEK